MFPFNLSPRDDRETTTDDGLHIGYVISVIDNNEAFFREAAQELLTQDAVGLDVYAHDIPVLRLALQRLRDDVLAGRLSNEELPSILGTGEAPDRIKKDED